MLKSPARQQVDQIVYPKIELITVDHNLPNNNRDWYKRGFDLTIVLFVHIMLFPFMLAMWTLIPLAIWIEDRGPVFYTQRRVGKNGKVFRLYKFRSMIANAESLSGPVWAAEHDARVTRVGSFIRARALDELPQIINVIKGDLSLVGPRPERPEFVDQFARDVPRFLLRLQVRPGLTGLAQIFGRYASKPKDKLRYDTLYIVRLSPWLDIKLLVLSVYVTFRGRWQNQDKQLRGSEKRESSTEEPLEKSLINNK